MAWWQRRCKWIGAKCRKRGEGGEDVEGGEHVDVVKDEELYHPYQTPIPIRRI